MSSTGKPNGGRPQFLRVAEQQRAQLRFTLDGRSVTALQGDTVLTAMLLNGAYLRRNEFSAAPRAGFCMMGACQDCWVMDASGHRLRACSTFIEDGMALLSESPGVQP